MKASRYLTIATLVSFLGIPSLLAQEEAATNPIVVMVNGAPLYEVEVRQIYDNLRQNPDGSFMVRDRYGFRRNFDGDGRLVSRVDRNGNTMSYSYDSQGKLSVVTDTMGRDIEFTFNDQGRLVAITDFIGRQIRYSHSNCG